MPKATPAIRPPPPTGTITASILSTLTNIKKDFISNSKNALKICQNSFFDNYLIYFLIKSPY